MLARQGSSPQPPVAVSPQQQHAFEQLAKAVVDKTVSGFTALSRVDPHGDHQRSVDPRYWKAFKKHETVQVYRCRERARVRSPVGVGIDWEPMAKLLCVGTILGSVDDAMYGVVTPTELAMATRSLYIQDEFTEHRVLRDILVPTHDEPFRYLGIKWGARSSSIGALVKPRETLYLEATGCRDVRLHGGGSERIGFVVYHSIELPEMPNTDGMVRARISACYVFRQAAAGVVELYGTMTSDAGGHLPTKLAALAGATVMISVSRVAECALKKKLAWMVSHKHSNSDGSHEERISSGSTCAQCLRNLSSFSSLNQCAICHARVCSRCTTSRRLLLGRTKATLRRKAVSMCKSCVSMARISSDTAKIAGAEFASREDKRGRLPSASPSLEVSSSYHSPAEVIPPLSRTSNTTTQTTYEEHIASTSQPHDQQASVIMEADSGDEYFDKAAFAGELESDVVPPPVAEPQVPVADGPGELWMRINALRLQAEETYLLAKEQTVFMQQASASRVAYK